jgi:hypothetical protein
MQFQLMSLGQKSEQFHKLSQIIAMKSVSPVGLLSYCDLYLLYCSMKDGRGRAHGSCHRSRNLLEVTDKKGRKW